MPSTTVRLDTVEDLVEYISNRTYKSDQRWELTDWHRTDEWDDAAAGAAWEEKYRRLEEKYPLASRGYAGDEPIEKYQAEYEKYSAAWERLRKNRPTSHRIVDWSLRETGDHWNRDYIELSSELGELLDGIWKHAPAYRGATTLKRTGRMTIPGMLKRLGKTEIGEEIAEIERKQKELEAKNRRNTCRRDVKKLAAQMVAEMNKHPEIAWPAQLSDVLINMVANMSEE